MKISQARYVLCIVACVVFTTASSQAAFLRIYNNSNKILKVIRRHPLPPFQDVENTVIWPGQSNHLSTGLQEIKLIEFLEPANTAMTAWKTVGYMNPLIEAIDATSQVFYKNPHDVQLQNTGSAVLRGIQNIAISILALSPERLFSDDTVKNLVNSLTPKMVSIARDITQLPRH